MLREECALIFVTHTARASSWKPSVCFASGRVGKASDEDMLEDARQAEFSPGFTKALVTAFASISHR